ncbi:uncharacterized protein LOC143843622 [Paroedura picta]|uniref:uncharacterized protein LOC143843622 n=1 Tax=Paroedura picta TaxID=143630 RepID=UPI0040571B38
MPVGPASWGAASPAGAAVGGQPAFLVEAEGSKGTPTAVQGGAQPGRAYGDDHRGGPLPLEAPHLSGLPGLGPRDRRDSSLGPAEQLGCLGVGSWWWPERLPRSQAEDTVRSLTPPFPSPPNRAGQEQLPKQPAGEEARVAEGPGAGPGGPPAAPDAPADAAPAPPPDGLLAAASARDALEQPLDALRQLQGQYLQGQLSVRRLCRLFPRALRAVSLQVCHARRRLIRVEVRLKRQQEGQALPGPTREALPPPTAASSQGSVSLGSSLSSLALQLQPLPPPPPPAPCAGWPEVAHLKEALDALVALQAHHLHDRKRDLRGCRDILKSIKALRAQLRNVRNRLCLLEAKLGIQVPPRELDTDEHVEEEEEEEEKEEPGGLLEGGGGGRGAAALDTSREEPGGGT